MHEYIYFNGQSSADFDAFITNAGAYLAPEHSYESIPVPGRNGNMIIDNEKFDNVTISYPSVIVKDFDANFDALKAFFLSANGYQRLEDTFHPDEFYQAVFKGFENINVLKDHDAGTFTMVFERKPQKFLKSGEIQYSNSGGVLNILNPTKYKALPLIRRYGTGTLAIGDISITINSANSYTDIDCELQEAYKGSTNCNNNIILTNGQFPFLAPGMNTVTHSSGTIIVTPRWFTI